MPTCETTARIARRDTARRSVKWHTGHAGDAPSRADSSWHPPPTSFVASPLPLQPLPTCAWQRARHIGRTP